MVLATNLRVFHVSIVLATGLRVFHDAVEHMY
jgi:hypothetical protein